MTSLLTSFEFLVWHLEVGFGPRTLIEHIFLVDYLSYLRRLALERWSDAL